MHSDTYFMILCGLGMGMDDLGHACVLGWASLLNGAWMLWDIRYAQV